MSALNPVSGSWSVSNGYQSSYESDIFPQMSLEKAQSILLEKDREIPCYLIRESRTKGQFSVTVLYLLNDGRKVIRQFRFAFTEQGWVENTDATVETFFPVDLNQIRNAEIKNSLTRKIQETLQQIGIPQATLVRPREAQRTKNALYAAYGDLHRAQTEEQQQSALSKAKELLEKHGHDAVTEDDLEEKAVILPRGHVVRRDTLRRAKAAQGISAYQDPFTREQLSSESAGHHESTILSRLQQAFSALSMKKNEE